MMSDYLKDYLFYASENEADPKLHMWAGLMTLSVAMSRKVWVVYGDWKVSPNMYLFFVGPPAAGKSVAMELAEKLVHDFTNIQIAPDSITAQSLVDTMAKECKMEFVVDDKMITFHPITIFSDELVSLLGPEPKNMIDLLTAMYSNRSAYKAKTLSRGKDDLINPCVTMICCLTPGFLDAVLTQKLITGGFTRRMTLIFAPHRGPSKAWPTMTAAHYDAKNRCVEYCKTVQNLTGPIILSSSAIDFFIDWYENVKDKKMRKASGVMSEYYGALNIQVLKVACLLAIAERPEKVIEPRHIETAVRLLEELEPSIMTILGGGGRNELAPVIRQIEDFIHRSPHGASRKSISVTFANSAKDPEIDECLKHLILIESIKLVSLPAGPGYIKYETPPTP